MGAYDENYKGHVVYCEKCKKIGLFEEMSPYGYNWFTCNPYKHKDCGGRLVVLYHDGVLTYSTDEWNAMSPDEKETVIRKHWEADAKYKHVLEEYEAHLSYEERKALDKEISDFRKYNDPNLTCPMCGSHVVKKLTTAERAVSVAAWGLASGKIGKQYECKKCGHKW